jgi:hypothetical protein
MIHKSEKKRYLPRQSDSDWVDYPRIDFGYYTYADESTLSKWERNALQNARRTAKSGSVNAARWANKDGSRPIAGASLTGSLLRLFNKRVLFVATSDGEALKFDGFVDKNDLNTIVIDINAYGGFTYMLGHEIDRPLNQKATLLENLIDYVNS